MDVSLSTAVLVPSLTLSLGWGIRGQFGGKHGAAIAGALLGLVLAILFDHPQPLALAAVAAVSMSFGGAMTYGQTIGLTHDARDGAEYGWGLFGLTVKGLVWMGLAGAWIGIASGHMAYSVGEIIVLIIGQLILGLVGLGVFNRPHVAPDRLPRIYFSDRESPTPRVEWWGGLLVGYVGLMIYLAAVKHDQFAFGMGVFGAFAGLGFPLGQTIQAWGRDRRPFGGRVQGWIDWWKAMELAFGAFAGGVLGLGWWAFSAMGLLTGRERLPAVSETSDLILLALYAVLFIAAAADLQWARLPLMAPFALGIFLLLAAFADGIGPPAILAGLLSAAASIAIARQLRADTLVSRPLAILIAAIGTSIGVLWALRIPSGDARSWFLFAVWFFTLATIILKAVRRPTLLPDAVTRSQHGYFGAHLRGWGSALPVELLFLAIAAALTVALRT